ncbi:hypothetical protein M3Y94_01160500 [Aphelenchoides besseyi]|nr:hypothetical protein M3Y94_01160500 [Aphelenchoides besseyi]KAI6228059.1 Arrestin domain-containing protein 5 [Aphelenchoides besseyi]
MSTSLSPPVYQTDLFLDQTIYNPGSFVNGQVTFKLDKKLHCDRITAQLYGSARVFFVQKYTAPGALVKTKAFEQEIVLVNQSQDLWVTSNANIQKAMTLDEIARRASSTAIRLPQEQSANRPGLEVGNQTFGFSFPLPHRGLYTSFDSKNSAGYIRYYILLKVFNGSCVVLRKKLLFPVVVPVILENQLLTQEERVISQRKQFDKNAYLHVELELEKKMFVPGEPVRGNIFIDNQSGKSVKYANLHIVQDTVCYSIQPEVQMHESSYKTAGMGLCGEKVQTHDQRRYPIQFNIPALVPNVDVPHCLHSDYRLQLDVNFVRGSAKGSPISIKVPIIIGTHMRDNANFPVPSDNFELPLAPPPYNFTNEILENSIMERPPAYSPTIGGLSAIDPDAQDGYAPLCYHYNFGFAVEDEMSGAEKKTQ